ncbi:hypothetical protein IWW54_000666 [Coemansia sp. RSA 2705]|nr:hypothetical protein IWW54_000666 [Coemansia sp. RSA 2705]
MFKFASKARPLLIPARRIRNYSQQHPRPTERHEDEVVGVEPAVSRYAIGASVFLLGGLSYYIYSEFRPALSPHLPWGGSEPAEPTKAEREARETARRQRQVRAQMAPKSDLTAEEQLKWAWTHPGLYAIGSNEFGLADPQHPGIFPGLKCAVPGLEGRLIRSAAFARTHAAAIDSSGSLFQWGTGFAGDAPHAPRCTLRDASICEVAATDDFVVARDRKSRIRVLRGRSAADTEIDASGAALSFEPRLGWRESVVSMSAGRSHVAVITDHGHVYTAALDASGNARGQLGHGSDAIVPTLTLRRIESEHRFASAACGAEHTLLLTDTGDVLGCGANDFGQLATGAYHPGTTTVPELAPLARLWRSGAVRPRDARVVDIAAGAATSYAQISQGGALQLLAWGRGIDGQLGNGTLTHIQGTPTLVPALSGRQEFDHESQARRPLGVRALVAGANHALAVCDNRSNVVLDTSGAAVDASPLFGHDVFVWGSNAAGQCAPGRRHRFATPEPAPLLYTPSGLPAAGSELRLQAAPPQWISTARLRGADPGSLPKTVLVEQAFVAGPDITAAFLRPCK